MKRISSRRSLEINSTITQLQVRCLTNHTLYKLKPGPIHLVPTNEKGKITYTIRDFHTVKIKDHGTFIDSLE